ncbi:hypothetical protein EB75_16555 [Mycobacterium sp. ST-F2]|uniref:hypothetical protein n=1 Tax=Mycobacterium sp. ST-F2 TaxID=1490484 RepID=UPI00093F4E35|nr:hypothetical protein [Mycobacterium sp. ST-F2]OKH81498.1 hypothetical protein EB75_16555 [Mycobacterium sp. ST-F2]
MTTSKAFGAALVVLGTAGIMAPAPDARALPGASAPLGPETRNWNLMTGNIDLGCVGLGPTAKATPKPTAQSPAPSATLLLPCLEAAPPPGQKCDGP